MGQARTTEKTKMYFASGNKVLVQADNKEGSRILAFDLDGYILHESLNSLRQSQILMESVLSVEYGKFFLLKNKKDQYTLL